MATSTLNISLPDSMRQFVENKITTEGYGTISEYIRDLIRADQRIDNARFDALVAQAYASGDPAPLTGVDIEAAREIVRERMQARVSKK